jgi:hypothetical protein
MAHADSAIRRKSYVFRDAVEQAVVERAGSISVPAASLVHTAIVALRRHLQAERRLADQGAALTVEQWGFLADRSVRYKQTVDTALAKLGLDANEDADPWERAQRAFEQAHARATQPAALPAAIPSAPNGPPSDDNAAGRLDGHSVEPDAPAGR